MYTMEFKEKAQKCRVICLDEMNLNPLNPGTTLDKRDKAKLTKRMEKWFRKTDEEIDAEFNAIVNDKILFFNHNIEELPIKNNEISYAEKSV